jgi:DNA-binding SARP family transcriptional activator
MDIAEAAELTVRQLGELDAASAISVPAPLLVRVVAAADDAELTQSPRVLLHLARALEPSQRLSQRTAALDRVVDLVGDRDLLLVEVRAERAIDLARQAKLDVPERLAREVLADSRPGLDLAHARASEALGRVMAWRGDQGSVRAGAMLLARAAERYERLGCTEWQAFMVFWAGNAVDYQWGDLVRAESQMRLALDLLTSTSPRRAVVLTFLADLLTTVGDWAQVGLVLDEATELAALHDDVTAHAYASWQRARVASLNGDADATLRLLSQTERYRADWFDVTSGSTYLADAAELLDRVGLHDSASAYLRRAQSMDPEDEFVLQAEAVLLARRGDPDLALVKLRALAHAPYLEPRLAWRRSMLSAYASLRGGRSADAGVLAAQALAQAAKVGGPRLALTGEPAITRTLIPLAAGSGSVEAGRLLAPPGSLVVRILGTVSVARDDDALPLPTGLPGTLFRLLASRPASMEVEEVIDLMWPDVDLSDGRGRLRTVLARLHAKAGTLVLRTGSQLSLAPAWVDARAFRDAADDALADPGESRAVLARSALAIWGGDLLPSDPYESWAAGPREELRRRRIRLLDVLAGDAAARGSLDEACHSLERAIEADRYDETRYLTLARHLDALGRRDPARQVLARGIQALADLGLDPTPDLARAARAAGLTSA